MLMLVDLPKPVHGLSNINKKMVEVLKTRSVDTKVINTAPSYASKYHNHWQWPIIKIFHTLLCYVRCLWNLLFGKHRYVYRSINGGTGQIYDLAYLGMARLLGRSILIHHHSFNYLNKHSGLFRFLLKIAGRNVSHIALGKRMKEKLTELYDVPDSSVFVISNLAFSELTDSVFEYSEMNNDGEVKIGHLSNLCFEKGLDVFLDACKGLEDIGFPYSAYVVGPCTDDRSKGKLNAFLETSNNLSYLGPLYSDDKENYLRSLDCFVFPTKYRNEAEPLVLYEAARYGCFLIGSDRGCMADSINSLGGMVLKQAVTYDEVVTALTEALKNNMFSKDKREERISKYRSLVAESHNALNHLMEEIHAK
ncbi:glycosyltransferase [Alteromonas aestuariivivens]|uniref:Glycosyltransferase n=1 Tax=Alteromonas aestuariivivens TaxID=1938339 RepID=A0A3D8MD21_9ALTE|nr:glycosyltransferase family 4 protein [Alteromonas aestuariivivens]RDV28129.1 glycosyltransferase [Alteromonas aestuariivivens]